MRLVEEGRLSLDQRVVDYLPWFTLADERARDAITIRQLLSHTAGFPAEYTPEGPRDEGALVPALMEGLPALTLAYFPGEGYLYSNWGIRLLSEVIEAVTGKRYSDLAREYIFSPLKMNSATFFGDEAARLGALALPHERSADGNTRCIHTIKENYARLATGGLFVNAHDLLSLSCLIFRDGVADDGARVLLSASIAEMQTPISTTKSGDKYGLTMQQHTTPSGVLAWGHYGNAMPFTSALIMDMERGIGVVVFLNTTADNLRQTISDLVLDEIVKTLN
jgi:CubicO group peptidase (beta-lactamase class C family)